MKNPMKEYQKGMCDGLRIAQELIKRKDGQKRLLLKKQLEDSKLKKMQFIKSGWIDITRMKPRGSMNILVEDSDSHITVARWYGGKTATQQGTGKSIKILAWQPLPDEWDGD